MVTKTIKRSEIATLKGLGATAEAMAINFGITEKEMKELMMKAGFIKGRKKAEKEPEYIINYVDDTAAFINRAEVENTAVEA